MDNFFTQSRNARRTGYMVACGSIVQDERGDIVVEAVNQRWSTNTYMAGRVLRGALAC